MKPKSWLESLNCAIEGVLWSVRSQRHMRYHFLAAALVLAVARLLHLNAVEFVLLTIAITLVLFAELFNTALERVVDLVSPEFHPLAKQAKDVAAGAVLVTSVGAAMVGYLTLSRSLLEALRGAGAGMGDVPGEAAVVSVLTVTILVVLLKARFRQGSPLHGGMPSGHSAIAFSIATSVAMARVGLVIVILVALLATMVSQSRLLMQIHSLREVVVGALLGTGVTLALFLLFH